jgi:endo-1,4-beta-D-glucanase Y
MNPLAIALAAVLLAAGTAQAQDAAPMTAPTPANAAAAIVLLGTLPNADLWQSYKSRFVTEQGRVVDTANGNISHSEGQGYGMLLAVAANDRATFERIWGWTRANLFVRSDELMAWRWEPNKRPAISDMNDASDGDILVAWALTEAAEAWSDTGYRVAARRVAVDVGRKVVLFKTDRDPYLLPAISGFSAEDRSDGPVINLSYWVFPALLRLPIVAPEFDWARLTRTGLDLMRTARFGASALPTEWISVRDAKPRPADGFPPVFSYNAIRIPLYLIWAGLGSPELYGPYVNLWTKRARIGLPVVDVTDGRVVESLDETGYATLAALLDCAAFGTALPDSFLTLRRGENYYPATLQLLAISAANSRHRTCLAR